MGLFDQMTCGCSNENTSCTTDNEPVKNVGVGSTSPEDSCNVGVGSSTPAPKPKPAPKPAPVQSCCNVGIGSSSADPFAGLPRRARKRKAIALGCSCW